MTRRLNDPEKVRKAIIAAYGGKCQYCRRPEADHIDHIVPIANGGGNDLGNLTLACDLCNSLKSTLALEEGYIKIIQARAVGKIPLIERILTPKETPGRKPLGAPGRKALILARMDASTPESAAAMTERVMNTLFGQGWEDDPNPRPMRPLTALDMPPPPTSPWADDDLSDVVAAEREREASRIGRKARPKGTVETTITVLDLPRSPLP